MATGINLFIEVKINGKWQCYSHVNPPGLHPLFAKMANVSNRYEIKPIDSPRGLPDDISELVECYRDQLYPNFFSPSYLSMEELGQVEAWYFEYFKIKPGWDTRPFGYFMGSSYSDIEPLPFVEDVRAVFFFDR